ncbi:GtrA family protein [Escherichia coli]|uniref:GtrA family protein n=1 Tax=Escherichia coli TaxID=562 RepID=UPI001FFF66A0|nr:GtrA family protein [Escherichia coli]
MYSLIGVLNTGLHWVIFFIFTNIGFLQSLSNLVAFSIASSFSYAMNSKFNFKKKPKGSSYILFVTGLGILSLLIGSCADRFKLREGANKFLI